MLNVDTPYCIAFSRGRSSAGISFMLGFISDIHSEALKLDYKNSNSSLSSVIKLGQILFCFKRSSEYHLEPESL